MTHETKNEVFLEKIIIFLIILVGAILVFNQFQYTKFSSNVLLTSLSFLLILSLVGLVSWLFISKNNARTADTSIHKMIEKKPFTLLEKTSFGFVALVAVLILFNQFQILQVNALVSGTSSPVASFVKSVSTPLKVGSGNNGAVIGPQLNADGRTTHLVEWQTISETPAVKSTGKPTKEANVAVKTNTHTLFLFF